MKTLETRAPWDEDDAISPRAADFIERQRFAEWSDADQAELDAWLAESTYHHVAYLRLEAALAYTDHLAEIRTFKIGPKLGQAEPNRDGKSINRRFALPLLAAASIALAATLGYPYLISLLQPPDRSFSTDIGDHTLLKFSDGTEIELNTNTAMRYRMTTTERIVWLDRGEAWFRVSHNAANPFAVVAGKHRVTDLGTEFLVRRGFDDSDRTEVTLLNGRAELSTSGAQTAVLKPGDDAVATSISISVTRKTAQELSDELAWRRGSLVFRNTKLSDVVREFNRYNTTKLVIADPSIADVKIYAEIKTDHFDDLLSLMQTVLNLRIDREGNEILISRGKRTETKKAARTTHSL